MTHLPQPPEPPFDDIPLESLRLRQSAKWKVYAPDVLPLWIAEMDYPLAPPIERVLHDAIARGDCGYAASAGLGAACVAWARQTWNWAPAPEDVHLACDVVTGLKELLSVATTKGDRVVIDTPVYPPFAASIRRLGRVVAEAPLVQAPTGWALDLDAIRRQYRAGAKAHILCSPHNPTGIVYDVPTLREIANMAEQHGVLVLSDEIHAPLTHPGATHTPFPAVSEAAAARSIVLTSASKAWNLAGLKAAVLVAGGPTGRAVIAKLPPDTPFHAGHLGVLASRAAFEEGAPWLARVRAMLDRNRTLFGEWLASSLPEIGYTPPQAGYLAWLDFRRTPLGADPAQRLLEHGRVALSPGLTFGAQGAGFARLNFATTRAVLEEATVRIGATVRGRPIGSST